MYVCVCVCVCMCVCVCVCVRAYVYPTHVEEASNTHICFRYGMHTFVCVCVRVLCAYLHFLREAEEAEEAGESFGPLLAVGDCLAHLGGGHQI